MLLSAGSRAGWCWRAAQVCLLALALLSPACGKRLDVADCEVLMERYVALLSSSDRPGTPEAEVLRLKQRARERAQGDPSFAACPNEVSRSQFECAMNAPNVDRFEQCLL